MLMVGVMSVRNARSCTRAVQHCLISPRTRIFDGKWATPVADKSKAPILQDSKARDAQIPGALWPRATKLGTLEPTFSA